MITVLVQFGGLDGPIKVFHGTDMGFVRNQIRKYASEIGTPENEIQILCGEMPKYK